MFWGKKKFSSDCAVTQRVYIHYKVKNLTQKNMQLNTLVFEIFAFNFAMFKNQQKRAFWVLYLFIYMAYSQE